MAFTRPFRACTVTGLNFHVQQENRFLAPSVGKVRSCLGGWRWSPKERLPVSSLQQVVVQKGFFSRKLFFLLSTFIKGIRLFDFKVIIFTH